MLTNLSMLVFRSATPKLYLAKPSGAKLEADSGVDQRRGIKRTKSGAVAALELPHARDVADRLSVGPESLQSGTPAAGRKKDKKSKEMVRMAGGQIWEDNSLLEWEDGKLRS
jgi:hypothetical protein